MNKLMEQMTIPGLDSLVSTPLNERQQWPMVKLGDVCTLINGRAYKQDELLSEGVPVIRIQNLNKGDRWYYSNLDLPEDKYCSKGDLLFAWSGTFGPYIWWGSKSIYHYHIWKIVEKNNILKQYLFFFLMSITQKVKDSGHGIALIHMTKAGMEAQSIPLPPLPEQQRIVARLDKAQQLIDKRKEQLALMDALVQSLFYEMFGDPVKNEKGWKKVKLAEGSDAINDCPHSTPIWTDDGYICLRTSNLGKGEWIWDDKRFVSPETYHDRSKRGYLTAEDIVISREGTVGIASIVPKNVEMCMGQRLVQIKPKRSLFTSHYLLQQLLFMLAPEQISMFMVGSTAQHLNVKELRLLLIPTPPLPLQQTFADRVQQIEVLKQAMTASLRELEHNFQALMQEAFGQ